MSEELLPCPFCGGPAQVRECVSFFVCCPRCDATGGQGANKAEAIAAWNRRTPASLPPDVAGFVESARLDAKAFRENAVYDSEGDPVRLTVTADRIDSYATALEAQASRLALLDRMTEALRRFGNIDLTESGWPATLAFDILHAHAILAEYDVQKELSK